MGCRLADGAFADRSPVHVVSSHQLFGMIPALVAVKAASCLARQEGFWVFSHLGWINFLKIYFTEFGNVALSLINNLISHLKER